MLKNHINIVLGLLSLVILFHITIILKIVPYDMVWGGRLTNDTEMFVFETISILINIVLLLILLMKGNRIGYTFSEKIVNGILWGFFIVFILNTIGNLFAKTFFEKFFAIITVLLAILIWKILMKKQ